jgi:pentapeptide MXKDX repeat protein
MKIRSLALAAALAITASGYAIAQSSNTNPSEKGSKGPDTATSEKMPNDTMSKDTMAKDKMKSGTTGAGTTADDASGKSNGPKSNAAVSPASPNSGEKQQK